MKSRVETKALRKTLLGGALLESSNLKKSLLGGISVVAFTAMVGASGYALATEVTDNDTILATDAAGLDESNEATAIGVTIDSTGGAITLGADATPSATITEAGGATALTLTVTTSGTASGVIFAGDVDANGNVGDTIVINVTNDDVTFQGNIQSTVGTKAADINLGSGTADLTMTVDTVNNEDLTIEATIDAVAVGDTVTLAVANTDGNANTVTFTGAIGSSVAIDELNLGAGTTTVFEGNVTADTITNNSSTTTTFEGSVVGDIKMGSTGTVVLEDGAQLFGTVDAVSSAAILGTLEIKAQTGGAIEAVSESIGATGAITEVIIDVTSDDVSFGSTVNATTITVTADNDDDFAIFEGDVTGAIVIETAGSVLFDQNVILTGSITTDTDGVGTAEWGIPTANSTLASGAIGTSGGNALAEVIVNSTLTITSTFESTVDANIITINSAGTVQFNGVVTGDINLVGDATAFVAANTIIVGDVDNTSTADDSGTLTFGTTSTDTTLVSGDIGASNTLAAVNVTIASTITATLAGDVSSEITTVNGTGILAIGGNVTGDVNLVGASTLSLVGDNVFTGNIDNTSTADGSGTVTFDTLTGNNTTVITGGAIGATNSLAQVTIDTATFTATFDGAVNTVAFEDTGTGTVVFDGGGTITNLTSAGDVDTGATALIIDGTIDIDGDLLIGAGDANLSGATIGATTIDLTNGSVTFDGTAAQTVTALIDEDNDITVSNTHASGVTFESAIGSVTAIDALVIGSASKATFNSTAVVTSVDLDGSIQVEDTMTVSGDFNAAADSTITIGSGIGTGDTAFDVDTLTTGTDVKIVVTSDHADGDVITLFGSNIANNLDASDLLIEDNAFFTFTVDTTGDDIIITLGKQTTAGTASTLGVSTQDAIAVTQANVAIIADGDTTVFDNFNAAINAGGADATKAAETVAVQADTLGAGTNVAVSTGGQVIGISSDRLGSLRTGNQFESSAATGFATGDVSSKYGVWVKPFGNWAEQDNTSGVAGFEALTYGMAFGADTAIDDQYRGGVSFAYASSDVEGSGAGQSKADIDSYQLTLYGDFTGKNYYAEASLGYAYNNNTVSRVIDFMGTDTTASGEYGSSQFIASFNTGIPMQMAGTAYFTPTAGLAWTHVISESYTETGAGGLNQTVDIDDIDVLLGTLGAKMHTQIRYNKGYLVPNIHGGVSYDFIGDSTTATATYTGGGAAFTVAGAEVEQFGGNLGFGFTYESGNFWSIGAGYDADMKSGFISHSALFEARFKF